MATITSVLIGDERSQRDITTPFVHDQIKNGKVDVISGSSLIPVFETTPVSSLNDSEEADIKDQAVKECGGNANDNRCIESTTQRMRQAKLQDKMQEAQSSINQIKGRRLTVNYVDDKGVPHTVVVPDGQKFTLDNVKQDPAHAPAAAKLPTPDLTSMIPSPSGIVLQIFGILGTILMTFLYVFSVAATYKTLTGDYSRNLAIAATAAAAFFPYSGYFIMLGYFLVREVYKYQTEDYTAKIIAWVIAAILVILYASSATFVGLALAAKSALTGYFFPVKK